jgi:MFS family permease
MAVYRLFLHSRGLDQFHINIVNAIYVLVTFLTDVPTGAFADAVGRRTAVVISCALHAVAFAIYFLSQAYWQFIIAACVDGLGATFGNGPIDAWAIDALDHAGFQGRKDALFSRRYQIAQIIGMAATVAGAYLAQVNIAAPFIVTAIVWSASGLVALALMDGGGVAGSHTRSHTRFAVAASIPRGWDSPIATFDGYRSPACSEHCSGTDGGWSGSSSSNTACMLELADWAGCR